MKVQQTHASQGLVFQEVLVLEVEGLRVAALLVVGGAV